VSEDSSIKKWKLEQPQLVDTINGFSSSLSNECLDICEDLNLIAGLSKKDLNDIILYNTEQKKIIKILKGHTQIINCVLLSKKKKMVFSGGDDNVIRIHCIVNFTLLFHLDKFHMSDIRSMTMNPSETYLLTAGHDKRFNLISLESPETPVACGRIKQRINKVLYIELTGEIVCISDAKQRFYVWNINADSKLTNSCKI
jgi:WD40 repeat protein